MISKCKHIPCDRLLLKKSLVSFVEAFPPPGTKIFLNNKRSGFISVIYIGHVGQEVTSNYWNAHWIIQFRL